MPPKAPAPDLPPEAMEIIARRFKVLSEPMRLRLLHALQGGEKTVTELIKETGSTQANISKHLSLLSDAGMVDRRRAGIHAYYYINDPMIFELCELVCSGIKKQYQQSASLFK
jgi:ArsR family transcriptional regulator